MKNTARIRELITRLSNEDDLSEFVGVVTDEQIDDVAKKLELPISGSFREFCRMLGSQDSFGFCGVDSRHDDAGALWETRMARKEYGLPKEYLVIWTSEGFDKCAYLDTSQINDDGECPVYVFLTPDWDKSEKLRDSFCGFFEHWLGD